MELLGYVLVIVAAFVAGWKGVDMPEAMLLAVAIICGTALIIAHRVFKPWREERTKGDKKEEEK